MGAIILLILNFFIFWGLVFFGFLLCGLVYKGITTIYENSVSVDMTGKNRKLNFQREMAIDEKSKKLIRKRKIEDWIVRLLFIVASLIIFTVLIEGLYKYGNIVYWSVLDFLSRILGVE